MIYVRSGGMLPSFKLPSLPTTIKVDMFFDRKAVKDALSAMEYRGLTKASLLVRRTAQKSITKVGMAKPQLRVMKANPSLSLAAIAALPSAGSYRGDVSRDSQGRFLKGSGSRQFVAGVITEKDRAEILQRIREIKARPASQPGSPPNTHVPFGHMLGFRRNLYNAYDKITHSAVVGPSKKGPEWTIPQLHEFGGAKTLRAWVWQPKYPRYKKPIIQWLSAGDKPGPGWTPTQMTKRSSYPARPYMKPALDKSRPQFAKFFEGAFSAGVYGGG